MYNQHFGFVELPFSIVPNSRFLYLSQRHKEAMHHLRSGLGEGGGFAMLTGEVGTGKTTVAKAMVKALDSSTQIGSILNPTFSNLELLQAICDEFALPYSSQATLKQLTDTIKQFLLESHRSGKQTLVMIDEAQHLSAEVLEQLRLLTNLETEQTKLLKVLLIGQPELQQKLQLPQLRQLSQRITGRYHLLPLNSDETAKYIQFRLQLAGATSELFSAKSCKTIAIATQGIPRLINLVCDAALKRAFSLGEMRPSSASVQVACEEVMSFQSTCYQAAKPKTTNRSKATYIASGLGLVLAAATWHYLPTQITPMIDAQLQQQYPPKPVVSQSVEVFPSQLNALLSRSSSLAESLNELYYVWGYQASVVDKMCVDNPNSRFACVESEGDLAQLRKQNLPVVLTLDYQGDRRYAVLYRASEDRVQLLLDSERVEFESKWLKQIWHGEYRVIYQKLWQGTLKPGMRGKQVVTLDQQLSRLLKLPISKQPTYGSDLERKVSLFQQWQGLNVDGIAGEQTLQRLELLVQEPAPYLSILESI